MTSVQERLKLKRAQIDTWSIREQLCLASSVLRSGDQNWMSVSRSLKAFGDPGRPPDWFSQKSCAVQYSNLLENVETPKRKKRTDKGDSSVETPSESIVRRLTQERIEELKRLLSERKQTYAKLKDEVMLVKSGNADERLSEMCQEIEEEKRQKERKAEAHERWLKEREEKKVELERAWKPPVAPASPHRRKHHPKIHRRNSSQSEPSSEAESALDSPLSEPLNVDVIGEETVQEAAVEPEPSQTPTSPLLTSLLKSPSPAPTSQGSSILHSAITSHRGASPTITSLLSSAPGVPGTGNMVTVAPPTTVSSSLKNLVSSAISSEQPHHQPPPHNPSPAAGAPTLSMLLELPPSLPGKPLPELPSAAKTTTLPPSTVSTIVSTAITPVVTPAAPKIVAVRAVTTAVAPTTSKITSSVSVTDSNEAQSSSQEVVKIADSTSRDDDIELLQVDSTQNSVDAHQMPIETKEELIEEVLIEEVVVNDDSVIESELLNSQISDVVVTTEQEGIKEKPNKVAEEIKLQEPFIEVSQSAEIVTQKEDIKTQMVADVDSTSSNSELPINIETTNVTEEKTNKDECIEAIIETNSQELVSEMVTEETAGVEVVPATEEELTSGAVAEVIEITDDQETIQTEVVDECGPCMQELEDMEVIILDKVQGLDEVQIVEDMKELECEVVEVVMGTQEKVDDELKEDSGELVNDSVKPEDVTSVESCSVVSDTIIECKSAEDVDNTSNNKTGASPTTQGEENGDPDLEKVEDDVLNDDIPSVEEEIEEEEEKSESISGIITTENDYEIEDSSEPREIIVERSIIVEEVYEEEKEEEEGEDDPEKEELTEDVQQDVTKVNTSDSPVELESNGGLDIKVEDIKESEIKDTEDIQVCEVEGKVSVEEDAKDVIEESEDIVDQDSSLQNTELKEDKKQSVKKESTLENVDVKKDLTNKDELKKDVKESQRAKKDIPPEPTKTNDASKKNPVPKEPVKKVIDDIKKDTSTKEQKETSEDDKHPPETKHEGDDLPKDEGKVSSKEIPKRDTQKGNENSKKVTKEPLKKDVEKVSIKEKDIAKRENLKKDVQSPAKEIIKELSVKEIKKDTESKDCNKKEVQIVLSKDSVKTDIQTERDIKKSISSKETPKKDITSKREVSVNKKELPVSKRDIPITKREPNSSKKDLQVKEVPKDIPSKREMLRRDSRDDISKKEILKRNVTKEERKEPLKDDLRKKPHIREITKPLKKAENEAKSNDTIKPEPVAKVEKNKKESEPVKEESKEVKREKPCKDSSQKEEDIKDEQPLKESKIIGNSSKSKTSGEEISKPTSGMEKKDGKENKEIEKSETVSKLESLEHIEEKPEKRSQLRSETPSTEDDKTNDAEPPKVIGRKRLAAVNVMDSVPNSPASTTDEEREYKSWKKSIMLLYGRLATHKYASLFLRPITDDQAPGYSSVVHRPIDLLTIKKNIETGVIRTTAEFQRDVMLMFLNSIMYNKSNHLVHKMAKQMQQEGMQHIQDFITTQMLVQVVGDGVPIRRETRTTEANKQRDILGNPSNAPNQEESESSQLQKRKRNTASDSSDRGFKKKKVDE